MVSREEVIAAYRMILGREPESEEIISYHTTCPDVATLRRHFLKSPEFFDYYNYLREPTEWDGDLDAPRLIFVHLAKCGGSTIYHLLKSHFPPEHICPERFNTLGLCPVGKLAAYRLFSGHFDFANCRLIPGKNNQFITSLRDPISRLISMYRFFKAHRKEHVELHGEYPQAVGLAKDLSIKEFFRRPEVRTDPGINNGIARTLAGFPFWTSSTDTILEQAMANLERFAGVVILEEFDATLAATFEAVELPFPAQVVVQNELEMTMHSLPIFEPVEAVELDGELQQIVEELIELDRAVYNAACERMRARLPLTKGARPSIPEYR